MLTRLGGRACSVWEDKPCHRTVAADSSLGGQCGARDLTRQGTTGDSRAEGHVHILGQATKREMSEEKRTNCVADLKQKSVWSRPRNQLSLLCRPVEEVSYNQPENLNF